MRYNELLQLTEQFPTVSVTLTLQELQTLVQECAQATPVAAIQPQPEPEQTVYTVAQAAVKLDVAKSTIIRRIASGEIRAYKEGVRVVIPAVELSISNRSVALIAPRKKRKGGGD